MCFVSKWDRLNYWSWGYLFSQNNELYSQYYKCYTILKTQCIHLYGSKVNTTVNSFKVIFYLLLMVLTWHHRLNSGLRKPSQLPTSRNSELKGLFWSSKLAFFKNIWNAFSLSFSHSHMCIYIINCENTYSYVKCTVHDSPVMDKQKHSHKGTKYNLYSGRANMHISDCWK